jgi:hypothetical protein
MASSVRGGSNTKRKPDYHQSSNILLQRKGHSRTAPLIINNRRQRPRHRRAPPAHRSLGMTRHAATRGRRRLLRLQLTHDRWGEPRRASRRPRLRPLRSPEAACTAGAVARVRSRVDLRREEGTRGPRVLLGLLP